jgi:hypothetical protein
MLSVVLIRHLSLTQMIWPLAQDEGKTKKKYILRPLAHFRDFIDIGDQLAWFI